MSEKVDVWMPFYVKDYLAATTELSIEEHGAYTMLLFHMWTHGGGSLPLDHERLGRICRMSRKRWEMTWALLQRFFTVSEDGATITQKRLSLELEKAQSRRAKAADSGRRSGEARRERTLNDRSTDVQPTFNDGSTQESSTDVPVELNSASASASASSPSEKDPPLPPKGFEEFWEAYPKKKSKDDAMRAWRKKKPPLAEVLKALSWQTKSHDWTKEGGAYVPHPASYLNGGGWKDERQGPAQTDLAALPRLTR